MFSFINKNKKSSNTIPNIDSINSPDIISRVTEHLGESFQYFPRDKIVGIFLQGSQNYGLDLPSSDVDTKLIVIPTFEEIVFNKQPHSTTHIRKNEEHIDFKDIRLYMQTFRKQNLNFLEILFTKYKILNECYEEEWNKLVKNREAIARMNPYRAVQSMKGIAFEKFHALKHPYPSKTEILNKFGYDPKQLHHLLRVEDYLDRYINGEPYEECLKPTNKEYLLDVKKGKLSLDEAEREATIAIRHIEDMANDFYEYTENKEDENVIELLNEVQYNIMKKSILKELIN